MANSLLDFVMSLVRDPEAAARYAADPGAALAEADLTDVTSVDVDNLIPVVAESMPMPSILDAVGAEPAGNVWASGAATAAFDAFADPTPAAGVIDTAAPLIDTTPPIDSQIDAFTAPDEPVDTVTAQVIDPVFDDVPPIDSDQADAWTAAVDIPDTPDHTPGFDFFD